MDPIQARSEWSARMQAAARRIIEELTPLAIEDFTHQVGPRGCAEYTAYNEAREAVESALTEIGEEVASNLQSHMLKRRQGIAWGEE